MPGQLGYMFDARCFIIVSALLLLGEIKMYIIDNFGDDDDVSSPSITPVYLPTPFASFLTFVVDKSFFFCSRSAAIPLRSIMIHMSTYGAPDTSPFCHINIVASSCYMYCTRLKLLHKLVQLHIAVAILSVHLSHLLNVCIRYFGEFIFIFIRLKEL